MNIIVMGCGRMGEQLARMLVEDNHFVTVIDSNSQNLEAIGTSFKVRKILGIGFDREILLSAGIETADAFAATSSSDNMNVVAARTARAFLSCTEGSCSTIRSTPGRDISAFRTFIYQLQPGEQSGSEN